MLEITATQRRALRARAHALKPVVLISQNGLTDAVMKEIGVSLASHELIKIRVFSDDRAARELMYQELAAELGAAPIQHIGKLLVLWRPQPEKVKAPDEDRMPGPRDVKVMKYSKRGGQRPEIKQLRVLGNQRLTSGGQVKRAKKRKPTSVKKRQAS